MNASLKSSIFAAAGSIIVATLLTLLPLAPAWAAYRPAFIVLTVLFWTIELPYHYSFAFTWLCGLIIDTITGSPLGLHGLALVAVVYIVAKLRSPLWAITLWQQTLCIIPILGLYEFILFWLTGILDYDVSALSRWMPVVSGTIIWPLWRLGLERFAKGPIAS